MSVGQRVAEEESHDLERYFVETNQWKQLFDGKIDVVLGAKGTGKSALYTLLSNRENELAATGIHIIPAEKVRGSTIFKALVADPPPSEAAFIALWKLYFLTLVANELRSRIPGEQGEPLVEALVQAGVLPAGNTIQAIFAAVQRYLKKWASQDRSAVEWELSMNDKGLPSVRRRTELNDIPCTTPEALYQDLPVEELLDFANDALDQAGISAWITLDRLDVAFVESAELEKNALRALFRTYNDLKAFDRICPKIFVRSDVWARINEGGFTEASHITKTVEINWNEASLLNVAIRRILDSDLVCDYLNVDRDEVIRDFNAQEDAFYRICPEKIDVGRNPKTLRWIVGRTTDGLGVTAPRELIHLLDEARLTQIGKLERGEAEPPEMQLFDRSVFKEAHGVVSKTRLEQTLYAEYPSLKGFIAALEGEKVEQTPESLSAIWRIGLDETHSVAKELTEVGFFESRGSNGSTTYKVPFLYRPALEMVLGRAEP